MSGYLLHENATVLCQHAGQAQATVPNSRVKVSSMATVQQPNFWSISGCTYMIGNTPSPCVAAQWVSAATRVKSGSQPLLLQDSSATCIPNGTGVNIVSTQTRVRAQ